VNKRQIFAVVACRRWANEESKIVKGTGSGCGCGCGSGVWLACGVAMVS